ncbi:MAG: hypothetical protein HDS59_07395 [Barnesiella sp.]|nr:hypothetical protein [Barnesiella sp.]
MKYLLHKLLIVFFVIIVVSSCKNDKIQLIESQNTTLLSKVDSLNNVNEQLSKQLAATKIALQQAYDDNSRLSFTALQRLQKINQLKNSKEYNEAKSEIRELVRLFPKSEQASSAKEISDAIEKAIKQEELARKGAVVKVYRTVLGITLGDSENQVFATLRKNGFQPQHENGGLLVNGNIKFENLPWEYMGCDFINGKLSAITLSMNCKNPQRTEHMYERGYNTFTKKFGNYNEKTNDYTYWEAFNTSIELYHSEITNVLYIKFEDK